MFNISKEYIIFDYEGVMKRFDVKYDKYKYCIVKNVKMYRYNKINYLVTSKHYKRTRNANMIIGRIYIFYDLSEYVKANMMFDAYYMNNVNTSKEDVLANIVYFDTIQDIVKLKYEIRKQVNVPIYVLKDEFAKTITKDKHRRINAIGIKECLE